MSDVFPIPGIPGHEQHSAPRTSRNSNASPAAWRLRGPAVQALRNDEASARSVMPGTTRRIRLVASPLSRHRARVPPAAKPLW